MKKNIGITQNDIPILYEKIVRNARPIIIPEKAKRYEIGSLLSVFFSFVFVS